MALGDFIDTLFGGDKSTTTEGTTDKVSVREGVEGTATNEQKIGERTVDESALGSTKGQTSTVTDTTLRKLSPEQLARLDRVAADLEERIGGVDSRYKGFVDDLVSSQRERSIQDFERGGLSKILGRAQDIGSLDNTTSKLLLQRGKEDLITNLNAQESETRFLGEKFRADQLAQLVAGVNQTIGTAKGGLASATGGETTDFLSAVSSARSTDEKTAVSSLTEALSALIGEGREVTTGETTTTEDSKGLLDRIFG